LILLVTRIEQQHTSDEALSVVHDGSQLLEFQSRPLGQKNCNILSMLLGLGKLLFHSDADKDCSEFSFGIFHS
jgi:hypothetical protein